jgi:hypothetical protein
VDTPDGPLDCLITGPEKKLKGLDGEPAFDPHPSPLESDGKSVTFTCLDERGLVVLSSGAAGLIPWTGWKSGVDGDVTRYPYEVVDLAGG